MERAEKWNIFPTSKITRRILVHSFNSAWILGKSCRQSSKIDSAHHTIFLIDNKWGNQQSVESTVKINQSSLTGSHPVPRLSPLSFFLPLAFACPQQPRAWNRLLVNYILCLINLMLYLNDTRFCYHELSTILYFPSSLRVLESMSQNPPIFWGLKTFDCDL